MLQILWIIIPIIIAICMFLLYWFYLRNDDQINGWECIEGDCEQVLDGEYKTYELCKNRCEDKNNKEDYCESNNQSKKIKKNVSFSDKKVIINKD